MSLGRWSESTLCPYAISLATQFPEHMIRAGTLSECDRNSGEWVFVDLGFSNNKRSCGMLIHDGEPAELRFSELTEQLLALSRNQTEPMNLLLEAPLSVAFDENGNPTGRRVERRGPVTRYWYVGLGCSVLVAATYVLRAILDSLPSREIRLFEGLASFKAKGSMLSHSADVVALREIVWNPNSRDGQIVSPEALKRDASDHLRSAFAVAGMDFGVPPIVAVGG